MKAFAFFRKKSAEKNAGMYQGANPNTYIYYVRDDIGICAPTDDRSAVTLHQHLRDIGKPESARTQQHGEVKHQIRRLAQ